MLYDVINYNDVTSATKPRVRRKCTFLLIVKKNSSLIH